MDDEFWNNLFENVNRLFIEPEIELRLAAGTIDRSWRMWGAQVLMNVGDKPQILFNNELKGVFTGVAPKSLAEAGKKISVSDLDSIEAFELTTAEPDAAHITMLLHRDRWWITFDLRYNRARVFEYLGIADEFLETASACLANGRLRAFVENLLAACEHLARGYLLVHPDEDLLKETSSHNMVQTRFNQQARFGNVDQRYSKLLNRLWDLRKPARYRTEKLELTVKDAGDLLAVAQELRATVEKRLPGRAPS